MMRDVQRILRRAPRGGRRRKEVWDLEGMEEVGREEAELPG